MSDFPTGWILIDAAGGEPVAAANVPEGCAVVDGPVFLSWRPDENGDMRIQPADPDCMESPCARHGGCHCGCVCGLGRDDCDECAEDE